MPIVSNTSPLIAFSKIDRLDMLRAFAERIIIPTAVADELLARPRTGEPIIDALNEGEWIVNPPAHPVTAAHGLTRSDRSRRG